VKLQLKTTADDANGTNHGREVTFNISITAIEAVGPGFDS
jgi:hypothetical protein